jgi:hypothetical protein
MNNQLFFFISYSHEAYLDYGGDEQPAHVWAALGLKYNTATSRSGRLAIRRRFQLATMKKDGSHREIIFFAL